jgi:hypothetical protein
MVACLSISWTSGTKKSEGSKLDRRHCKPGACIPNGRSGRQFLAHVGADVGKRRRPSDIGQERQQKIVFLGFAPEQACVRWCLEGLRRVTAGTGPGSGSDGQSVHPFADGRAPAFCTDRAILCCIGQEYQAEYRTDGCLHGRPRQAPISEAPIARAVSPKQVSERWTTLPGQPAFLLPSLISTMAIATSSRSSNGVAPAA